jgi:hypothetical protein
LIRKTATLGGRAKEFRLAIDPCGFKNKAGELEAPMRALDRVYAAYNRWKNIEADTHSDTHGVESVVGPSLRAVLAALQASDEEREEAFAYVVRGDGALPWTQEAPARWLPGASTIKHGGNKAKAVEQTPPPDGPSGPAQVQPKRAMIEAAAKGLRILERFKAAELDPAEALGQIWALAAERDSRVAENGADHQPFSSQKNAA